MISQKKKQINFLKEDLSYTLIEDRLSDPLVKKKIAEIEETFKKEVCSDLPIAFWERKRHTVSLPYEKYFSEKDIPTKARPIQMIQELLDTFKKEIKNSFRKENN